jgi:cation diffusion facilitator family transporter
MAMASDIEEGRSQRRTAILSISAAAVLVGLKLGVGAATGSLALISTGVESSGDVVAAALTFFAVRLGGRPADPEHPYGHRRAENLGALGEATILLAGGLLVAVEAIRHLVSGAAALRLHWYLFAVLGAAIVVDFSRTQVSLRSARRYGSAALRSNAFHFASDLAGSVTVLLGLAAVSAGVHQADSIAALLVAAIIAVAATRLLAENANVLMDRTPEQARRAAEGAIARLGADLELDRLRLRESGGRYFADVVVTVPPGRAVVEGHETASKVESAVEQALPGSDVVVHVEPRRRGLDVRERVLATALREPLVMEAHDIAIYEQDGSVSVSLHLKFPPDVDLRTAAQVAARVERAIRADPRVGAVQTHLEPLERTLPARPADSRADAELEAQIEQLVRARTGSGPQELRLLSTAGGPVVFVTLGLDPGTSLSDAHQLAGELEDELRKQVPGIADVVIHTQP